MITSKVNSTDKTLDIYSENKKTFSFVYGDDYIEYNNRSTVITEENLIDNISTVFGIQGVMESVFVLSGHENKTLSDKVTYTDTYDTYGIQLETESYNFSGTYENGGSYSKTGNYIKYFKISLDTEKINALITKYGVDVEEQDPNKEIIANLTPTLEATNITENSVTIHPKINYFNTDPDYIVYCFVYRSDSENGTYEKISDLSINCLDSVGIVDEGLKSNTTYYYKTIVDGGNKYSEPIAVTTKESSTITNNDTNNNNNSNTNNNNNNSSNNQFNVIENPKTGFTFPTITILLTLIGSISIILYTKKIIFNK